MGIRQGSHSEGALWLYWILATALGSAVGWLLGLPVFLLLMHDRWGGVLGGAVIGALIGAMQWFVLRRWDHRIRWWVLASAVIWGLSLEVINAVSWQCVIAGIGDVNCDILGWAAGGLVGGTSIGIVQWSFLRQRAKQSGWWVLASAVGWSMGWAVGMATDDLLVGAVAGGIAGVVTGCTLGRLLRRPMPKVCGENLLD